MAVPQNQIAVFAHNEEARIIGCLESLPLDRPEYDIHVLANGCTDQTVARCQDFARGHDNLRVHDIREGGKSNAWNCFIHELAPPAEIYFFVDGDALIHPGSLDSMVACLAANPGANAVAAAPLTGRRAAYYRSILAVEGGVAGALYALRGRFVDRIREKAIRLPKGLVGDDSLVGSLARTDLTTDSNWDASRTVLAEDAGFYTEVFSWFRPSCYVSQFRRLINYSVRYFQNRILRDIMRRDGAEHLPPDVAALYAMGEHHLRLKRGGVYLVFDWLALRRIRRAMRQQTG